ncbi:MAG TPA: aromatic amino acid hydroxylase [Anaeromyxobacteraceae bacterium]|nr:aromatic amino acid hydroxylase [Anaeromyxobacteraceae bacterium]
MTATEQVIESLPPHLRRYAVAQEWEAYTPRDHAVWRYVMRRLTGHLADKAHPSYLSGLAATGISVERIPRIDEMNERLAAVGWSAVPVRGFVPPAVFTELQSLGVLAIAADIRSVEHLEYTPAPDIVHESAGHAPIIANRRYAEYLRRAGEVGFRAIASAADQAAFEAVRNLSVVKEDPAATPAEIQLAEERLQAAAASRRRASENARASRLYWWTAEYGLMGEPARPRLYGAGLLSSIGESARCLGDEVRKVELSPACADVDFDITRMQPQLFVARDFDHLFEVVEAFEATLSWRRGGDHGLAEALAGGTVVHLGLDGGRELTGRVAEVVRGPAPAGPGLGAALARLEGPVLRSSRGRAEGRPRPGPALVAFGREAPPAQGAFRLALGTGLELSGFATGAGEVVGLAGSVAGRPLDLPGTALLLVSASLPSVAGGPADAPAWDRWFGALDTFAEGEGEARARARKAAALSPVLAALYRRARALREAGGDGRELDALEREAEAFPGEWLLREELRELRAGGGGATARLAAGSPP